MNMKPEQAFSGFKKGPICPQVVISVYAEEFGLPHQTALKIARRFEKRNGSNICTDPLDCDISKPEGTATAGKNNLSILFAPNRCRMPPKFFKRC